jgi:hypothetical protein
MRSHHAPTKNLLERFTFKDRHARSGRSIWIYEKGVRPRISRDLRSECSENGYFSGSPDGQSEMTIESELNKKYEIPFNKLLSAMDCDLHIFESLDHKTACAAFVSNLFHRSKARRAATGYMTQMLSDEFRALASNESDLKTYAASLSLWAQRTIFLDELRVMVERQCEKLETETARTETYLGNVEDSTEFMTQKLLALKFQILRSSNDVSFSISDTPVISRLATGGGNYDIGVGINHPGVEWFLPISHSRCLRISDTLSNQSVLNDMQVLELNKQQSLTMFRRMYSKQELVILDQWVQEFSGHFKYVKDVYKPNRQETILQHLLNENG